MGYESYVASGGGDILVLAKSFVLAGEGAALSWFSRVTPLGAAHIQNTAEISGIRQNPIMFERYIQLQAVQQGAVGRLLQSCKCTPKYPMCPTRSSSM